MCGMLSAGAQHPCCPPTLLCFPGGRKSKVCISQTPLLTAFQWKTLVGNQKTQDRARPLCFWLRKQKQYQAMVGPGSVSCSYSDRVPETVAGVSAASAQGAAVRSLENSHPLILLYFSSSDNIFLTNSLHETPVYSEHPEQFLFS